MTSVASPSDLHGEDLHRDGLNTDIAGLVRYLRGLNITQPNSPRRGWSHTGTVLVDAVLQERTTYDPLLRPKAEQSVVDNPKAANISGLIQMIGDPAFVMSLPERSRTRFDAVISMATVLRDMGCETVGDIRRALDDDLYGEDMGQVRELLITVAGADLKTIDMLAVLAGADTACVVDGRIRRVLSDAGVDPSDYRAAKTVVMAAAKELSWSPSQMDATLWNVGNRAWIPRYG